MVSQEQLRAAAYEAKRLGITTPSALVELAKSRDNAIISAAFSESLEEFAYQGMLERAREIFRVKVIFETAEFGTTRAPLHIRTPFTPADEQSYSPTEIVRRNRLAVNEALIDPLKKSHRLLGVGPKSWDRSRES